MSTGASGFATDEDLAVLAARDFALLCPSDQVLASGTDGQFAVGDPWTIQSASVDFLAAGLAVGHIVMLGGPTPPFRPDGELLAVRAVTAEGATLKRVGLDGIQGQPPAPSSGVSGVVFQVSTLGPQILQASLAIRDLLGIPATETIEDLDAAGELREATAQRVLQDRYASLTTSRNDAFALKAEQAAHRLESVLNHIRSRWACGRGPLLDRFATRILR